MLKPVLQPKQSTAKNYLTVSQLNRKAKGLLEQHMGQVWVQGEISNFSTPASGHWYFTLKDDNAHIRCAMWRGKNQLLKFTPKAGQLVLAKVKVTLYEARGDYQLNVEFMEPFGIGAMQLQFEQLKEKLASDGLFDASKKKNIPNLPARIGLITSPTGAAVHDVLSVMERRSPMTDVIIYPCQVQGKTAHHSIIEAIKKANQRNEVELILITRGGGSLEDLWCFNEEALAYEIAQSQLPTISAVGHEVDFTISDFVADLRTPTPSAAAELITGDQYQLAQRIDELSNRLSVRMTHIIEDLDSRLNYLRIKLADPEPLLTHYQLKLQDIVGRLSRPLTNRIQEQQSKLHHLQLKLTQLHPMQTLTQANAELLSLRNRLERSIDVLLNTKQQQFTSSVGRLNTISPLATLERGYSITLSNQQVVRSVNQVTQGEMIESRLKDGTIKSKIMNINKSKLNS